MEISTGERLETIKPESTCFCVYKHTSPSGKIYIGITSNPPQKRWYYGNGYRSNEYFYRAIKKYKWKNFKHEILYSGLNKSNACELEALLIEKYRSANPKFGYNETYGGEHNFHTAETKRKIAEKQTGHKVSPETRAKLSELAKNRIGEKSSRYGKPCSEETKERIMKSHNKTNKPVFCIELGKSFWGLRAANREANVSRSQLKRHLDGCAKYAGRHPETGERLHWYYVEDLNSEERKNKSA